MQRNRPGIGMGEIEWHAEAAPCGRLHVEAEADRPGKLVRVWVDGVEVHAARGSVDWIGSVFGGSAGSARVAVGSPRQVREVRYGYVDATATVSPPPWRVRPGVVPLRVRVDTSCPSRELAWTLRVDGGAPAELERRGLVEAEVGVVVPEGCHDLGRTPGSGR